MRSGITQFISSVIYSVGEDAMPMSVSPSVEPVPHVSWFHSLVIQMCGLRGPHSMVTQKLG